MESLLAYATVILAAATAVMAWKTWALADESKEASYRQIGVQTWLELEKRWDSRVVVAARKKLAGQLKSKVAAERDDMSDSVPNFFEDLGILYRSGYIDKALTASSFSLYASRYWEALKPFVDEDRRHYGGDSSINEDFEFLAKAMLQPGEKISESDMQQFLDDESKLPQE